MYSELERLTSRDTLVYFDKLNLSFTSTKCLVLCVLSSNFLFVVTICKNIVSQNLTMTEL